MKPISIPTLLALLTTTLASQCPVPIDLTPGPGFSRPSHYADGFGEELYFAHGSPATGTELWKWSPATGVIVIADVKAGTGTSSPQGMTTCCTAQGPRVFFSAAGTGNNGELWSSDGTPGGFSQVKEIRPGSSGSTPGNFVAVGARVFFTANDGSSGFEPWVSDGTDAGTHLVEDLYPGSINSNPKDMVGLRDRLLFTADDGTGRELWVSDGTGAGTVNLGAQIPALGQSPYQLTPCGDVVFFTTGNELWQTDGTVAGTTLVQNVFTSWSGSVLDQLTCCGDRLFFAASVANKQLLFVSDGTSAGTYRVQGANAVQSPRYLTSSNGRVFFSGTYFDSGSELWVSDGTDAGTVLAADINPGATGSRPQDLAAVGTGVCFYADDGTHGGELWFSDGTAAGTWMVCDLDPTGSGSPHDLHVVAGQLWLRATSPGVGTEPHVLATPGAHVEALGVGGAPDYPRLATRDGAPPVLGTTIEILADDGPAGHTGLLFVAIPGLPGPPLPPLMQGGCDWVGLLAGTGIAVAGTVTPTLSVPLALPNQANLEGARLELQVMWYDAQVVPPIQLSNGLQLVLGESDPH